MSDVYEIVRSRVPAHREAEMLALRPRMIAAMKDRFPELVEARLLKLDDGTWMDVVRWRSREAAERAAREFAEVPEARAMGALVEQVLSFDHGIDLEPKALSA